MVGDRFEGHDVLVVRDRLRVAVDRARNGDGPTLVEVLTYRFRGHSMSDPGSYRTQQEIDDFKRRADPCNLARKRLLELGMAGTELEGIESEIEAEITDAVDFATQSPPAAANSITRFVYAAQDES
ncbi:MAG: thiamine pyrophosphate-dependent enzyme [Polyangiaceae bacterium]